MKKTIYLILLVCLLAMPSQAEAKPLMAQTKTIPLREYTPGTYEVELNTLPGNSAGAEFIFTRDAFPGTSADTIAWIDVYMRTSNTASWTHVMGAGLPGGVIYNRWTHEIETTSRMLCTWPGEAGPNGRVVLKGSDVKVVAVVYQTFSTSITLNSISSTGK